MIVVDASVMVEALLRGGRSRDRIAAADLAAPHLLDIEVAAAVRGQLLGGVVETALASAALQAYRRLEVDRFDHAGLLSRVWELRGNLTAHDATYVALAEALAVPLVTGDARIAAAPGLRAAIEVVPA
ncbi:type II toxin-antitoxin system VapC family toxin [Aquipuribacter sp. MA13-6]|uniref:type II toxin-antitoxin system VapC family toxin n=1 Tax=unclassified Aquipuribacter TaxID=2635084 RepID=UPI003EEF4BCF